MSAARQLIRGSGFAIPRALMKLVIVDRSKAATYERMRHLFAGDPDVSVIWDRRTRDDRRPQTAHPTADRSFQDRRQLVKDFGVRGFIVVDVDDAELPFAARTL